MALLLGEIDSIFQLNSIQSGIEPTDVISGGAYMCDCTGCSNYCFEACSDGNGPTN